MTHYAEETCTFLSTSITRPRTRGEDDTLDIKEGDTAQRKLWVLLPGGMTSADTFYTWDAIKSGLFEGENWCIFHNPNNHSLT